MQSSKKTKFVNGLNVQPRCWFYLKTLDFYILREYMIHFMVLMLLCVILFLMGDVFNDLSDFLKENAKMSDILTYFLLKMPGNIRFVLPISVLLAAMWTMAKFGKNLEVTAMRASGVSLFRCGGSLMIVGLIVTAINIWFNEKLVPKFNREAEVVFYSATNDEQKLREALTMMTYRSPDKLRTWLFKNFDATGDQQQITLKKYRQNKTLEWDIQAQSSRYEPGRGWTFFKARLTPYTNDGLMPKPSKYFEVLVKDEKSLPETPKDILDFVKPAEELSSIDIISLLRKTKNMAPKLKAIYWTVFYHRMAFPWSCFLAVFLGIPLATKNERSGIMLAIVSAVLLIVSYYVISMVFVVLGKQQWLPPFIAGVSPTLAFIIFGWYNVLKLRH
jgi:lipopolysaccharide export system permease protein